MTNPVFLVAADNEVTRLVRSLLESAGYTVRMFHSGTVVLTQALKAHPSLFILKDDHSGDGGLQLCRVIRETPGIERVPIIFLSTQASETDRVSTLELGADDYITEPFSSRELVARIRAVLRVSEPRRSIVNAGEVEINRSGMSLIVRGEQVTTTATEFRLLEHFACNPGRVFSREQLLQAVWRDSDFVSPRSVDVYVRRIREKIERDPDSPTYLQTVRGAGYRFDIPD